LPGPVYVVKAQIHAGGRGKGGGVKLARSIDEVRTLAGQILGMQLKTHQTGPHGQKVRRLLIEEGADIAKELYVGMVVDRVTQRVVLMASSEGGMDIEEVAAKTPEKIHKVFVDPKSGSPTRRPTRSRAGSAFPTRACRRRARCCRASTACSTRPTRRSPRSIR
jgi:succinyl-CoA synthetase beta subunit